MPVQGARRAESKVLSASSSAAVAALTAADFSDDPTVAIHANQSGNLIGTLVGDTSTRTFVVVQGAYYPYAFTSIDATSAVQVVALFN